MSSGPSLITPSSSAGPAMKAPSLERRHGLHPGQDAEAAAQTEPSKGRQGLVAALMQALHAADLEVAAHRAPAGDQAPAGSRESKQALHAFTHELFAALRPPEAEGGHGRGFAWGRTSMGDLARRLEALVQTLHGVGPAATAGVEAVPATNAIATAVAVDASGGTAASGNIVGAESAAAKASGTGADSPLVAAFSRLIAAGNPGEQTGAASGTEALMALLQRMSEALRGDPAAATPVAGSLLHVTA